MRRLSIARSVQLALLGLALLLAALAGLGIAGLYKARQRYEDRVDAAFALAADAAQLLAASVVEEATQRTARRPAGRALLLIAIAGLLALLAVMGLVSALIARMRRPLSELVTAARRLESGDLGARVRAQGPAELRTLATAFNAMADNLAAA